MGFDLGSFAGSLVGAGASLAGGMINATASKSIAREQMALQREFAQNGIQWKVEDAKKAGLHPLYAIGASTATYTPVSQDSSAMGNAVADAGAYLGKAIDGATDKATRRALEQENLEYARQQRELAMMKSGADLMNAELVNRNLQLRNEEQEMVNAQRAVGVSNNPARPIAVSTPMGEFNINNPDKRRYTSKISGNGATAMAGVDLKPNPVVMTTPGNPAQGAGAHPDYELVRSDDGYKKVMSQSFAERTDDDIVSKIGWHLRHDVVDFLSPWHGSYPRDLDVRAYPIPKGTPFDADTWRFHPIFLEYMPYSRARGYWSNRHQTWTR